MPLFGRSRQSQPERSVGLGLGLALIYDPDNPAIDIVAVHGLNGDREKTWTADNGCLWLRDMLPQDIPDARVFSWGYNACFYEHNGTYVSTLNVQDNGQSLVQDLVRARRDVENRPIIFIAHSLGGLVVKYAVIYSAQEKPGPDSMDFSIKYSTHGIIFMGTPHLGSEIADAAATLINVVSVATKTNAKLIKHLQQDSSDLDYLGVLYGKNSEGIKTMYGYETRETPTLMGQAKLIVPKRSAVINEARGAKAMAFHADHRNMVRFQTRDSGYTAVMDEILQWKKTASASIDERWMELVNVRSSKLVGESLHSETMDSRYGRLEIPDCSAFHESWLLRLETYRGWNNELTTPCTNNARFLLLHGKPGSGKTVLTKLAVEDARKRLPAGNSILLYFFFSLLDNHQYRFGSIHTMYRAILHQLIQQVKPHEMLAVGEFLKPIDGIQHSWTIQDLQSSIKRILGYFASKKKQLRIYLDAIDECDSENDVFKSLRFFTYLIKGEQEQSLKIFLSSQNHPSYYAKDARGLETIKIEDHNHDALRQFVRGRLTLEGIEPAARRLNLEKFITKRAQGVFLWAQLVINDLVQQLARSTQISWKALTSNQPELSSIYERRIRALTSDKKPAATRLFQLMVFGFQVNQHFTLSQIRQAYAVFTSSEAAYESKETYLPTGEKFQALLRTTLAGLVEFYPAQVNGGDLKTVPRADDTISVHFFHLTVRKFLLSSGFAMLDSDLTNENIAQKAHFNILHLCLRIIKFNRLPSTENYNDESSLQRYAGQFWAKHAGKGDMHMEDGDLLALPRPIRRCPGTQRLPIIDLYQESLRAIQPENNLFLENETNVIAILAAEGSTRILFKHAENCPKCMAKRQDTANERNDRNFVWDRALFIATVHRQSRTVRCLRQFNDCKIDPNRLIEGYNAIYKACYTGQVEIVKDLLEMGADIFQLVPSGYRSCLHAAITCGHMDVVESLFRHHKQDTQELLELRVNLPSRHRPILGFTALHVAARWNRKDIAAFLLHHIETTGQEKEFCLLRSTDGRTAADIAEEHGNEGMKKLLKEIEDDF